MNENYDYGPEYDLSIRLIDEANAFYGRYEDLPYEIRTSLQLLAHAMIQLASSLKEKRALRIGRNFMMVQITKDYYCLSDLYSGMAVMNLIRRDRENCDIDFFSIKEMSIADPVLNHAYQNSVIYGRGY